MISLLLKAMMKHEINNRRLSRHVWRREQCRFACLKLIAATALLLLIAASAIAQRRAPLAYVSNERDGTISVIHTATDRVIKTIAVGGRLRGIHLGPGGRRLFVAMAWPMNQRLADPEKIVEIDTASGRIVA